MQDLYFSGGPIKNQQSTRQQIWISLNLSLVSKLSSDLMFMLSRSLFSNNFISKFWWTSLIPLKVKHREKKVTLSWLHNIHSNYDTCTCLRKLQFYIIIITNFLWNHTISWNYCFLNIFLYCWYHSNGPHNTMHLCKLVFIRGLLFTWWSSYVGLYDAPGEQTSTATNWEVLLLIVFGFWKIWKILFEWARKWLKQTGTRRK